MNKYTYVVLILIGMLDATAQNMTGDSSCATNVPDFSKLAYDIADKAATSEASQIFDGQRTCPEYATKLVHQLRYGKLDNDKKVLAIWLLGRLRAADSNSIEILIELVDLKATKIDPKTKVPRWGQYPAQEALVNIDQSSVNPVLQDLPGETNELRVHLLCNVLVQVQGYKNRHFSASAGKTIAQNQIKQMLADEKDSTRRANLAAALKELEK